MQVHMSPVRGFGGLRSRNRSLLRAGRMLSVMVAWAIWLMVAGCASAPVDPGDASSASAVIAETQPDGTPVPDTAKAIEPTVVSFEPPPDPLMGFNRAVFAFNDVTYRYAFAPLSRGYEAAVPQPVRQSIGNAFDNIKMPIRTVNFLLQGKFRSAGIDTARFVVNSTLGLAGLFDPAASLFGLEAQQTGFAQTLQRYGSGQGTFIVLPFYGPSDLRSGSGLLVDYLLNPIPYLVDQPEATALNVFDAFQDNGPRVQQYVKLRDQAEDPYLFMRDLYWQGELRNAAYPEEAEP